MLGTPTVSIGLPVRNGARYVAAAIESILAQTFPDFELIISDNASSDATAAICEGYAARDRRVRYYRHRCNLGASYNFNFVFHRSTGRYFKWAAHDDIIRATFLERAVAALDADPEAVLCQSLVEVVGPCDRIKEIYDHTAFGTDRRRQSDRLAARLRARRCVDIFGLIRRQALEGTALIADHVSADRTLLIELALRGRFVGVPEALFVNRDHPERFTRQQKSLHAQAAWYAPDKSQRSVLRTWILCSACLNLVRRYVGERAERRRCRVQIARSLAYHRRWLRLALEPIEAIEPRAFKIERWLLRIAVALRLVVRRRATRTVRGAPAAALEHDRTELPL